MNTELISQWEVNQFNNTFLVAPAKHKPIEDDDKDDKDKFRIEDDEDPEDDEEDAEPEDEGGSDDGYE